MTPAQLEEVFARLRQLAVNGYAPSKLEYNRQRGALPSAGALYQRGYPWSTLTRQAGLRPHPPSESGRDERLDAEIRRMAAAAEPARPATWPLFGIPSRTVVRERYRDGTLIRTTTRYYSLR